MSESRRVGGREAMASFPSSSPSSSFKARISLPRFTLTSVFVLAGLVRLVMIAFGEWQDAHLVVKYTDIDYLVFSDASAFVARGQSPYLRYTYRYSPLLAYTLLPNVWLHKCVGKLLFSAFDLLAGWIAHSILTLRGVSSVRAAYLITAWLFNPFTFTVATRGNCDAMASVIMLWVLLCLMRGKLTTAAIWYGLAVHLRIYPIVYALPFLLVLDEDYPSVAARQANAHPQQQQDALPSRKPQSDSVSFHDILPVMQQDAHNPPPTTRNGWGRITSQQHTSSSASAASSASGRSTSPGVGCGPVPASASSWCLKKIRRKLLLSVVRFVNRERLKFAVVSGGTFLVLTFLFFSIYGMDFLFDALLYHLTRSDPRHNFSIHFYQSYLRFDVPATLANKLFAFIPQVLVLLILGTVFAKDLPFCIFLQTLTFVAFNKVCTAQYFVWYFCLLPLILPSTTLRLRWKGTLIAAVWCCSQVHWLGWAFLLEFKGRNVYVPLWIASIIFFAANIWVMLELIRHHKFCPLFQRGSILELDRQEKEVHRKIL